MTTESSSTVATVTVYAFEIFDSRRRCWVKSEALGTLEAIATLGGVPLKSSALVVDAAKVGPGGLLMPPPHHPADGA